MQLMRLARILLSLACLFPLQSWSQAQTYPNKPIRMVVPYAPGASSDIFARMLGQKLTEAWGQQVV